MVSVRFELKRRLSEVFLAAVFQATAAAAQANLLKQQEELERKAAELDRREQELQTRQSSSGQSTCSQRCAPRDGAHPAGLYVNCTVCVCVWTRRARWLQDNCGNDQL